MVQPQHVYKAVDFVFEDQSHAPKYFVVFYTDGANTLLLSLTTSKCKLPADLAVSAGCVHFDDHRGYGHSYIWEAGKVIGSPSFSFSKRTYIQLEFRSQLHELSDDLLAGKVTNQLVECCCLSDVEYAQVLSCLMKSRYLKRKYKSLLEDKIQHLQARL